ncbi:MAG: deoxyhypusine synthase [Candidatus Nitrosocaldaceae archaeon]|nr:MAG: deoxyhypusine synthase [Candidatus Nitrosocaldaceae archaeon]
MEPVKDLKIEPSTTIEEIFAQMLDAGGFTAKSMAQGSDILYDMMNEQCLKFISFVGAIISTGLRGVIRDMLKNKMFDAVITTCGALDHDIARTFKDYYHGDFRLDDTKLAEDNIHRLGNILIPSDSYGMIIEEKMQGILNGINESLATYQIASIIGKHLDESSFLYWANKNDIPVFVPGIMDGAVGNQLWLYAQQHKGFNIDLMKDASKLADLVFDAKKTGALMIGGGISKHHTLWWNQFRGGLDYAVYITTANEYDGSLSGALVREAISWGKVKSKAKQVTIHGEATIVLPFLYAGLIRRIRK